jgi:methionine-rich copper-binding protein CopC
MMPFCVWPDKSSSAVARSQWTSIAHNVTQLARFECIYNGGVPSPDKILSKSRRAARAFAVVLSVPAATVALAPGIARAHAIVVAAQPAMNSAVLPGELEIRLDFNSRIDQKRSRLNLERPDGSEIAVALAPGGPSGVLAGRAQVAGEGRWKLRWQVLSLDGHITRGELSFSVRDAARAR